ncbi:hypothetical protein PHYBLDRAFT_168717 [Phycomyces blakesleeanus NRRL 1555(-)]|uniref:Ndc10 domain-containing protein n=1 Tax=Phycomyces blakesleeanus (strain ATCC 8743b / DSM 1359 / FGSC 10004 / NBRC 33097 / NRRL 1555) TaxID=763407 RepID=A0A167MND7_PHYB8|nr:hypothetical protein PHYBLDRAFT_168717 [Phycomyces blakesleeanus NRRL 1555(-)]OAD73359.1 hypothetical protein PHYBLDRAFT_168717 [Phycomyces blakesleeanus NRRL 1555(-)]|eukprot:XP_018291399.1 hypothetical protein PHYBLDRAFT_168717 [Phycomyces blakesleeanus NRRL 1555(-)]
MEAEGLEIPFDFIKRGEGWKDRLSRLETYYLGKLPYPFARGMSGFWGKPFLLARNGASPPVELKKIIFSWIKDYFGVGDAEWVAVSKRGFSRLLIRCRRIILQDAAFYLYLNKENKHINTRNLPFSSNSFKMFQEDNVAAITNPSVGRLEEYESLVPNIVDTNKEVASRVTEVNHRIIRLQQQQDSRFEKNENSFNNFIEQSNQQNLLLMNTTQQLAKDLKILMI